MGKKRKLKALKKLANNLAMINQSSTEKEYVTGAEILSWNTITEVDGKPIDPEKKYEHKSPVLLQQNNQRKMKRAFLRNGEEGVRHFLNGMINTIDQSIKAM